MSAEHKRPLFAFVMVSILCAVMLGHAIRSDALGGLFAPLSDRVAARGPVPPALEHGTAGATLLTPSGREPVALTSTPTTVSSVVPTTRQLAGTQAPEVVAIAGAVTVAATAQQSTGGHITADPAVDTTGDEPSAEAKAEKAAAKAAARAAAAAQRAADKAEKAAQRAADKAEKAAQRDARKAAKAAQRAAHRAERAATRAAEQAAADAVLAARKVTQAAEHDAKAALRAATKAAKDEATGAPLDEPLVTTASPAGSPGTGPGSSNKD